MNNSYDLLTVQVQFVQDVSNALPAPGFGLDSSGKNLGVTVALDTDGNPGAGNFGVCGTNVNKLTPFEYYTDPGTFLTRLVDGNYSILAKDIAIYQGASNPSEEAIVTVSGHTINFGFDLLTLGVFSGASAPKIGVSVAAFNGVSLSPTDCVPSGDNGVFEVFTTH